MSRATRFRARVEATFRQAVTVTGKSGENAYGEPVPGATETIPGRLEFSSGLLRTGEGVDVVTAGRLFVAWDSPVTVDSTITYDGRTFTVLKGGDEVDLEGLFTHQEWILGDG
jgi:hypothetical protein